MSYCLLYLIIVWFLRYSSGDIARLCVWACV